MADFDHVRRSAAAEALSRRPAPPPSAPTPLRRPIRDLRPRLDQPAASLSIVGSRSSGPRLRVPVPPVAFVKESLDSLLFNPSSWPVQKKLDLDPVFSAE